MVKTPDTKGICEYCREEYEGTIPTKGLYRIGNKIMCGDCANEWEGDMRFDEMAYGVPTEDER